MKDKAENSRFNKEEIEDFIEKMNFLLKELSMLHIKLTQGQSTEYASIKQSLAEKIEIAVEFAQKNEFNDLLPMLNSVVELIESPKLRAHDVKQLHFLLSKQVLKEIFKPDVLSVYINYEDFKNDSNSPAVQKTKEIVQGAIKEMMEGVLDGDDILKQFKKTISFPRKVVEEIREQIRKLGHNIDSATGILIKHMTSSFIEFCQNFIDVFSKLNNVFSKCPSFLSTEIKNETEVRKTLKDVNIELVNLKKEAEGDVNKLQSGEEDRETPHP